VRITHQPNKRNQAVGEVAEILGEHMAPGMEIDVAIRTHEIPHEWPLEASHEAAQLAPEVTEADKHDRIDLREMPFVTIDGEDARDFDDAVYCRKRTLGGWRLYVAIADVSHYVRTGTALDTEAHRRATSVYFPERVIPMLPEAISNGLCSLNPHVDRLVMVCEMTISSKGKLGGYEFYEGLIHSHARLTYTKVGAMLDSSDEQCQALREEYQHVVKPVDQLHKLYAALRLARDARGAIDFETQETRIIFGEDRKIDDIVPVHRNDAHKLIEECMLAANVSTAKFLAKHKLDGLFRVHKGPKPSKLENLRGFLGEMGLSLPGGEEPKPKHYQALLSSIKGRPDAH
jgi:ribonuclease R